MAKVFSVRATMNEICANPLKSLGNFYDTIYIDFFCSKRKSPRAPSFSRIVCFSKTYAPTRKPH